MELPEEKPIDEKTGDMFTPAEPVEPAPSEGVYVDVGASEMAYVGEVQLPRPIPVELVVEIDGWDYVYKLDRRAKAEA